MPNAYLSLAELRAAMPDNLRATTTKYDAQLLRLLTQASRWADNYTKRVFYPYLETRYFDGSGYWTLSTPDLISITSVSYSTDDGDTYTAMAATDYIGTVAGDYNARASYDCLHIAVNGEFSYWPVGQKSIKIVGVWGFCDDRSTCWESTGDTVEDNPLSSSATTLTLNDVDGLDLYGASPRFQAVTTVTRHADD